MSTAATIGYGYALKYSTDNTTFTALSEILDLKPGSQTREKVEVYSNTSSNEYPDKIPGWKAIGDYEADIVYTGAIRAQLETWAEAGTVLNWKFVRPNGTSTSAFQGFVSEISDAVPLKDKMSIKFKLTVTGAAAFAS